tara:strand:- start:2231 stop:3805 length:1575 start_codon:yes stop_codon:yes gene_type:complete
MFSCEQEMLELNPYPTPDGGAVTGTSGSADFTKVATIGGSFTAGLMDGTLNDVGQSGSLGRMISVGLSNAGGSTTFNQPDINSVNGYLGPGPDGVPGTADDQGKTYLTQSASTGAIGISFSEGDITSVLTPYAGDKAALNNFAFPNSVMAMFLTPAAGGPNVAANPAYNSFFARFDNSGATVSPLGQFIGSGATFFMSWLGFSDFVAYSARGGDENQAPAPNSTELATYYQQALGAMMTSNPVWKGVVGTVPDLLALPYFQFIVATAGVGPTGIIPLDPTEDAATIAQLQGLAAGFNQTVNGLAAQGALTAQEAAMRQLSWSGGGNSVLVNDESLTDLGPLWDQLVLANQIDAATRAQLEPYRLARQAISDSEILPLSAQTVLGVAVSPATPTAVWGVTVPLSDEYFLTASELQMFETARATVNAAIVSAVTAVGDDRVAIADFNGYFEGLATAAPFAQMNTAVTYDFAPPTGMFSTDGIHPNARGYGLIANKFFAAINEKFGSTIPDLKVGNFVGAPLPVTVE